MDRIGARGKLCQPADDRARATPDFQDALAGLNIGRLDDRAHHPPIPAPHAFLETGNNAHERSAEHDRGVVFRQDGHQGIPLRPRQGQRHQHQRRAIAADPKRDPGDLASALVQLDRLERLTLGELGEERQQRRLDLGSAVRNRV